MADVELYDPISRDILIYDEADVPAVLAGSQMRPPTDEERRAYDDRKALEGNKLLAGAEQVAGAATFGLVDKLAGTDEEAAARKRAMEREHPAISFGTTVAGAAVPTVLAGAVAAPVAGAVGLGRAGAAAASVLAEGAAGGLAEAAESVRQTDEAIDYWNALAWGIGGSVLGHGLASLTRRGAVVADNVLARAERQALDADARAVRRGAGTPADAARSAEQVIEQASDEIATGLENAATKLEQLRGSIPTQRLDDLVAGPSPALDDWTSQVAADLRQELVRRDIEAMAARGAPTPRAAAPVAGETQAEAAKRVLAEIRSELKPGTEAKANARVREGFRTKTKTTRRGARIEQDPLSPEAEAKAHAKFAKSADLTPEERAVYEALEPGLERQRWRERFRLDNLAQHFAIGRRQLDSPGSTYTTQWGAGSAVEDAARVLDDAASDPVEVWRAAQTLVREMPDSPVRAKLRQGLEDPALFGRAAELAERLNAAGPVRAFRRDEIRAMLSGDAATVRAARAELDQALDALDTTIAAHREFGVGKVDDIEKLRDTIRREVASADDARVSRSAADIPIEEPQGLAQQAAGALRSLATDKLTGAAVGAVLGGAPGAVAGFAAGVARDALGRVIRNMSGAQKAAVARAARGFVAGGARAVEGTARATGAGSIATLMDRFVGEYPNAEASYRAKTEALKAAAVDPTILPRVMAASFGELPIHYPRAYTNAAAQLSRATAFLVQNLPTSTTASILSPRGLPPSRQQIREFAALWTAVTEPETVLEAVEQGGALPKQVEALKAVHPGMYAQLRQDIIAEVSRAPEKIDTQRKVQLDILFEADGLAGLAYSWEAARLFREAQQPALSPGRPKIQETLPREPAGIAAAKNGPTMG